MIKRFTRRINILCVAAALSLATLTAHAGGQLEEPLSASVRSAMYRAVSDKPVETSSFVSEREANAWLSEMSRRMAKKIPDEESRLDFLRTVHYEATRAGLDAEFVLGLIQVESGFRKYAVSPVGARGYMQVMPFWVKVIGARDHNLFHLRTNLRYGCTILRHYLNREKGDYFRALGRYNGSLGQSTYPTAVVGAWKNNWTARTKRADNAPINTRAGRS